MPQRDKWSVEKQAEEAEESYCWWNGRAAHVLPIEIAFICSFMDARRA